MSDCSKFIKVRLSEGEYKAQCHRADAQGVTMSEYVRATVTAVHQSQDVAADLAALHQLMSRAPSAPPNGTGIEQR